MTYTPEKPKPHNAGKQTLMHDSPLIANPLALVGEDNKAADARKAAVKQAKQTIAGGAMLFPLDPNLLLGQEESPSLPNDSDTVREHLSPHEEAHISALFEDIFLEETPHKPDAIPFAKAPSPAPQGTASLTNTSTATRNLFSPPTTEAPLLGTVYSNDNLPASPQIASRPSDEIDETQRPTLNLAPASDEYPLPLTQPSNPSLSNPRETRVESPSTPSLRDIREFLVDPQPSPSRTNTPLQEPPILPSRRQTPPPASHDQRAAMLSTRAWEEPELQTPASFLPLHEDAAQTKVADFAPLPPMINTTLLDEPTPPPALTLPVTTNISHPAQTPSLSNEILSPPSPNASETFSVAKRTTVLPEVDLRAGTPTLIQANKERYEFKKTLGAGAVGEVELARDNDIHRMVAIKRLKTSLHSATNLLRFAEEIRTVGSLEHPNIIPIHDVGIDEEGRYYFVMKHIQGVTLEHIIERLQAGDAEYHAKYTFEYRTRICTEILRAMQFAHSNGVIHRDLKPANIMVGPFGEVVVMDWGIAKRIRQTTPTNPKIQGFLDKLDQEIAHHIEADGNPRERLFQTRNDTLLGTPMYMSPEQALGHNDKLDERSDIYSLFVVFYEFLTLHHYLEGAETLEDLLRGIMQREPKLPLLNNHPAQTPIPADLNWFLLWGLQKAPDKRPATVDDILHRLQRITDGYAPIQCPVTLNKRAATGFVHFINRHPLLSTFSALLAAVLMLGGSIFFVKLLIP